MAHPELDNRRDRSQPRRSIGREPDFVNSSVTHPGIGYGTLPIRRILVVQTQRLGDVLCTTPIYTALRNEFPLAHIEALVVSPHQLMLQENPDLNAVFTYDKKGLHRSFGGYLRFIGELKERQFDWALSIHASSDVAFGLWGAGIPWRTCVWRHAERRPPGWHRSFHQQVRQDRGAGDKHEVEHNLDVLRELGIDPQHRGYRVVLRQDERDETRALLRGLGRKEGIPLAMVHPGHGGGRQQWLPAQYAAVADGLVARGMQVAVTGSKGEVPLVAQVTAAMRHPVMDLGGKLDLRSLACAIADASLFVSVSTGPMHLAGAFKVPSVTVHGPADLRSHIVQFCTYDCPHRTVESPVPCPCPSSTKCENAVCMAAITPEHVLRAVDDLLS